MFFCSKNRKNPISPYVIMPPELVDRFEGRFFIDLPEPEGLPVVLGLPAFLDLAI
tara:strand:- start:61 stop:225 length:165 start_codon:yes stop_codon:yes gene_type:complete